MTGEGKTGQEMCEYILEAFPGLGDDPDEIWNSSDDGSLVNVFGLYWAAKAKLTGKTMLVASNGNITWVEKAVGG